MSHLLSHGHCLIVIWVLLGRVCSSREVEKEEWCQLWCIAWHSQRPVADPIPCDGPWSKELPRCSVKKPLQALWSKAVQEEHGL